MIPARQQIVERLRQSPEFVVGVHDGKPATGILEPDSSRALRHDHHRRQTVSCEEPADDCGNQQRSRDDGEEDAPERRQFLFCRLQVCSRNDDILCASRANHRSANRNAMTVIVVRLGRRVELRRHVRNAFARRKDEVQLVIAARFSEKVACAVIDREHRLVRMQLG
jgi:hypothetical protein